MLNEILVTFIGALTIASIVYSCFCIWCAVRAWHIGAEESKKVRADSKLVHYSIYIGGTLMTGVVCIVVIAICNGFAHRIMGL